MSQVAVYLQQHSLKLGVLEYFHQEQEEMEKAKLPENLIKPSMPTGNGAADGCPNCSGKAIIRTANGQRCNNCGHVWGGLKATIPQQSRTELLK